MIYREMLLKMLCLCFVDFNIGNVRIFVSVLIESRMANTEQMVKGEGDSCCFLCPDRGAAVVDGDLRGHLTYEHGIMFNMEFFFSVGDYMKTHSSFPVAPFILGKHIGE